MKESLGFGTAVAVLISVPLFAGAVEFPKNGPFDGSPFRPTAPITWTASTPVPKALAVYKIATAKLPQAIISNAMTIGSFRPINLTKSQDKNQIEFRDKPGREDVTRFLKLTSTQGWAEYYDRLAGGSPSHGVPTFEEAQKLTLRYFVLLGGNTNELPSRPWPHRESTSKTYDKPGGRLINQGVSMRSICLFRQIDGIGIIGNSLSADFGNDAKPITLEMNWPPLNLVERFRTASKAEILALLKSGKSFVQAWPPPDEDVTHAKSFKVKNVIPLYGEFSSAGERWIKPYGSLLMEADMNGRAVELVVNCPIATDEKAP
jgi:hypothetical protein